MSESGPVGADGPIPRQLVLRLEVEELLFREAELLDAWRLDEWLELLTDDFTYVVPTTDLPEGQPMESVLFINDDIDKVRARVDRLKSRHAHREYPSSRTRRLITNVRAEEQDGGDIAVRASFVVYRVRAGESAPYFGHYLLRLRRTDAGLRIAHRRATLDLELLRDHGAVSIIL